MTCPACGDKPQKSAREFPRAVIEIDNPEAINIFRKVVVPTSMGDDTDVPAAIGKYRNVLLNYEANNHTYLYSSDGIPTLLTSDIAETIEQRVTNLEVTLADEIKIREETDNDLQTQINAKADTDSLATVATTGSYNDLTDKPTIGDATLTIQKNSTDVGTFTANSTTNTTIDIAVPTTPEDIGAQAEITSDNKLSADLVDDTDTTNKFVTAADLSTISTALQPADIDKVVMTDIDVSSNTSTTTVALEGAKENLMSGAQTTKSIALPVASTTEAGVMNSATFDAVTNNTANINALLNGAVAVTGLSASPSQSDITTAWQTETGLTTLINRASVYDVSNDKVWTYYTNDNTWHAASNTAQVTINTFTNSTEGTIKGSTNVGQIFAENDGTGSVNGWDALNAQVSDNTNNIGTLQTSVAGKQDKLTAGSNITISSNTISATDTTYTAGTGLTLAGTEFSADTSVLQEKLTAGNAIDITSNVISADVYPADYFTAGTTVTDIDSNITLNNTLPVKLENVELYGDTKQQTYTGKNLFKVPDTESKNGVTLTHNADGTFNITTGSGSATANAIFRIIIPGTLPSGEYTLSRDVDNNNLLVFVQEFNNNTFVKSLIALSTTSEKTATISPTGNQTGFVIQVQQGVSIDLQNVKVQFESGSPKTSWEPYVGGTPAPSPDYPQDINVVTGTQTVKVIGKNLWSFNTGTFTNNSGSGVLPETHTDNTITLTAAKTTGAQFISWYTPEMDVTKTYTISGKAKKVVKGTDGQPYIRIMYSYSEDGSTWSAATPAYTNTNPTQGQEYSFNYTLPSGHKYFRFRIYNNTNTPVTIGEQTTYYDLQLEEGSTATSYQPYQSQSYTVDLGSIELCKIGTYQDYIYKSGDDWYLHKETLKEVFDGTESWNYGAISTFYRASHTYSGWMPSQQNLFNSHFTVGNTGNTPNVCGIGSTQVFMSMDASLGVTTKAEWVSWLNNNNVTIYTILATPTDTKITDNTLIGELEALGESVTYIGVTNFGVTAVSPNLPALLKPTAHRYSAAGVAEVLGAMPDQQVQANWAQTDTTAVDYIKNKPANLVQDASYVHTDNNFTTSLKDKLDGIASGAEVNVQSNWTQADTSADDYIKNKPSLATVATSGSYSDLTNKPTLATVATSGNYNDLTNKPSIPAAQIQSDWTQSNTLAKDYIKNKPAFSSVATSGSYNDLTDKPTIPTVNDATLTIQQNGTDVATFTANSSTNATANITAPVITMTTTDPGEGSALADNNYIGVYDGDLIIVDYSTTEINTGAKWIDGRAIYKKTIPVTTSTSVQYTTVSHGITNFGKLIKYDGFLEQSNNLQPVPRVVPDNASYGIGIGDVTATNFRFIIGSSVTKGTNGYVTLYYTKSS